MNKVIGILIITLLSASAAQAGTTKCIGNKISYVNKINDMGIPPRIGMIIGHHRLILEDEVLASHDIIYGGDLVNRKYSVNFDDVKIIDEKNERWGSSKVYSARASITEHRGVFKDEEIHSEYVLCEETRLFVP